LVILEPPIERDSHLERELIECGNGCASVWRKIRFGVHPSFFKRFLLGLREGSAPLEDFFLR
jgi:hypothetical protein